METWGQTFFVVLVPVAVVILGGLIHTVYRLGRLNEKVDAMERTLTAIQNRLWPPSPARRRPPAVRGGDGPLDPD